MEVSISQGEAGGLLATIGIDGGCLRYQAYTGVLWYVTLTLHM